MQKTHRILGLPFFAGNLKESLSLFKQQGGLLVAPSGPCLANLDKDNHYRQALLESDLVIPDSGFMVAIWNIIKRDSLSRISGYRFLKEFLKEKSLTKRGETFWIMPSTKQMEINLAWLNKEHGFTLETSDCYIAPFYKQNSIEDPFLLQLLQKNKPPVIFINIGGGIQEPLGLYLKKNLDYQPSILCTGAAIAFLSRVQAAIPLWVDRCYLGWLARTLVAPKIFFPRYVKAFRLFLLLIKYGEQPPI